LEQLHLTRGALTRIRWGRK